jgi:transposase-like protein
LRRSSASDSRGAPFGSPQVRDGTQAIKGFWDWSRCERIKSHLDRVVRGTVEETLNALLDAEADRLCNAQRYERSEARRDTRAGNYERGLQTKAGEVRLRVPKLRQQTFETAIIERYRGRESSVEEALIEMYLAGVSVRRVEDMSYRRILVTEGIRRQRFEFAI